MPNIYIYLPSFEIVFDKIAKVKLANSIEFILTRAILFIRLTRLHLNAHKTGQVEKKITIENQINKKRLASVSL